MTSRTRISGMLAGAGAMLALAAPALALEPVANERELLKECEARICSLANKKAAAGDDLKCALSKTWTRRVIENGIKEKKISWGFGDARCAVGVDIKRTEIVAALTQPAHTIAIPAHAVKCEIEREKEVIPISLKLAPKLQFKGGKLEKAWLNVSEIEAPSVVKGAIWTAAKLEDNVGLFHSQIVKEVNEFFHQKCPARHGG